MTKWIRWPGLVAFLVITGLLVAGTVLFSGPLIAKGVELAGTRIVGARVDVASARPGLFPLGLRLSGIEVTDPNEPMTNAIEIAGIRMKMDASALMLGKVDVREMAVEGIRMGTPRRVSGALPEKKKEEKKKMTVPSVMDRLPMPSMEIPDVSVILERASLGSLEEADRLERTLREEYERFEQRLRNLPDADDFAAYRTRIEDLRKGGGLAGVLAGARELREIKVDVDKDMLALRRARQEMEESVADLRRRIRSLKNMATNDVHELVSRYGISSEGLSNMTGLLLGPEWEAHLRKGLGLYRRVEPLLSRAREREKKPEPEKPMRREGTDIVFAESPLRPDFLIRRATLSLEIPAGSLKGSLRNATAQQPMVGSPMELDFKGDQLSGLESIGVQLVFDRVTPQVPADHFWLGGKGWQPGAMGSGDLTFLADRADFTLDLQNRSGVLKGRVELDFSGVSWEMADSGDSVRAAVASGLRGVDRIAVEADLTGTLEKPKLRISSSLDTVVREAVTRAAREATEALRIRLTEEVQAQTDERIRELERQLGGVAGLRQILDERLNLAGRLNI
ncbi:TIGR03545 family protein [Desulfobotulus sp. H1]|uniref:TIGR03545 family protein n=1 Tax=Desulfobotulus pelophilus TaxID=2823377 RepID=A0ABT3N7Y4_9BACT|nr:TIGR03545 family protein [Desulfobotulus pelophilus]MCW7753559.1 TIGR03545 family protein [Desulfobotulus pelophilus]